MLQQVLRCMYLFKIVFSFSLGKYPGVEFFKKSKQTNKTEIDSEIQRTNVIDHLRGRNGGQE